MRQYTQKNTIASKINKSILRYIVVTLVLFSLFFTITSTSLSFSRLDSDALVLSEQYAQQFLIPILFDDNSLINSELIALTNKDEITSAVVYMIDDGDIFRYPYNSLLTSKLQDSCNKETSWSLLQQICSPIMDNEEIIAYLHIEYSRQPILNRLQVHLATLIIGIFIAVFLARLMMTKTINKLLSPLSHLADIAQKVEVNEQDEHIRAESYSNDEIGILATAFNNMLDALKLRNQTLKDYSENLEQSVEDRTYLLEIAVEDAEQASKAKSEFLANISHELRTPMHGILSFTNISIDHTNDLIEQEELKTFLSHIKTSSERLMILLNDLLDLSKLEAGKMKLNMQKYDLLVLFESCYAEQKQRIIDLELNIKVNKPDTPIIGTYDKTRISQVITNILSNAIKFSPKFGTITVSISKTDDNKLYFSLKDQGLGLPKDELEDVFDAFIQSSKTNTGAGGTGLGLSICREIIKGHNGKIWAENSPDGGAIFTFII